MGAMCQGSRGMQNLNAKDMDTLRANLKSKAESYQSQIHTIQQQIRAATVLPPDSECSSIRALLQTELQSLRTFLLTLVPDVELVDSAAQTPEQLKVVAEELVHEEGVRTLRVVRRLASIEESVRVAVSGLRERGAEASNLEEVFARFEQLLGAAQHLPSDLAERVQQEEATTHALIQQSSDLKATLDLLSSDLVRKEELLRLTKQSEAQAKTKAVLIETDLSDVKGELLQCKEKIKEWCASYDQLEVELQTCSEVVTEGELQERIATLQARVNLFESLAHDLQKQVVESRKLEEQQETRICELKEEIAAKGHEDVSEKMSSVQDRLRDIMLSLESEEESS
jgi:hypothetical protein